jgi:S-adenosylmethionine hydrolase
MYRPMVTLTTDFGLRDAYAAEMKAVILGICPKAAIVDVSHQVEKFNVRMGAYVLASASPYFPDGTVHVAVVDPGVGTNRRPIIVQTERCCFVGPDNGVLALAVKSIGGRRRVFQITNRKFMLPIVSNTFHGRDIFAPAAAHLASGRSPAQLGRETHQMRMPEFIRTTKGEAGLEGQIVHIDDFGNIITSFTEKEIETVKSKPDVRLKVGKKALPLKLCKTYGDVDEQEPVAIIGSHNFLEVSVNHGSAARIFRVRVRDKVVINWQ